MLIQYQEDKERNAKYLKNSQVNKIVTNSFSFQSLVRVN